MKKIALLTTLVKVQNGEKVEELTFDYRTQLISLMKAPSDPRGADIEEIRRSIRVIDVLEAVGDKAKHFELEDADFEFMEGKVKGTKFAKIDKAIIEFVETVTSPMDEKE